MDPDWCLPSKVDDNPMAWMISMNGLIVDARHISRQLQEEAYAKGLIPYIPDDDDASATIAEAGKTPVHQATRILLFDNNQIIEEEGGPLCRFGKFTRGKEPRRSS